VTAGYAQVTSGDWPAVVIGAVGLLILIMYPTAAVRRELRRRRDTSTPVSVIRRSDEPSGEALGRCWGLIAEALIVQQRLCGQIDAETYQARMNDLARQAVPQRPPQRNA
jgi:hypothetical protein